MREEIEGRFAVKTVEKRRTTAPGLGGGRSWISSKEEESVVLLEQWVKGRVVKTKLENP